MIKPQQDKPAGFEKDLEARWSRRALVMGQPARDLMVDMLWIDCGDRCQRANAGEDHQSDNAWLAVKPDNHVDG